MQITISDDWQSERPRHGPITVGWLRANEKAGILYDPPERVTFRQTNRTHAKSAARCPAVIQLESRYFMIRAPFDLHLGFQRDDKGRPQLVNRGGAASAVRGSKMGEVLSLVAEAEWRYPDRPTIQLHLPYIFVADEPVYIS